MKATNPEFFLLNGPGILDAFYLAPYPIVIFQGFELTVVYVNAALLQLWGKDKSIIGQTFIQILPELAEQPFPTILRQVLTTGVTYEDSEALAFIEKEGTLQPVFFDYTYSAIRDVEETITGVLVICRDVSAQVFAKKRAEESELKLKNTVLQAPVAMAIIKVPELIIETANQQSLKLWKRTGEIIGKEVRGVFPEVSEQGFIKILHSVINTGEPYYGSEIPVELMSNQRRETVFMNYVFQPIFEDEVVSAVMTVGYDVTELVLSKKRAEKKKDLLEYLNFAGEELALTLDTKTALDKISHLIVPRFADWFTINVINDGYLDLLLVINKDPAYVKWATEYRIRNPITKDDPGVQGHVLRTGEAILTPIVTDQMLETAITDEEHLEKIKSLNLRSSIVAPMKVGNKVTGSINFISTIEGKQYNQTDLNFAKDFASRIALALENARLHEQSRKEIKSRVEAENKKDEFISVASHELKTPLTTITASIQILKRIHSADPLSKSITKLIETSENSGSKLQTLVDELLNVSNIESGRLKLNKTMFNLADLINECCAHVRLEGTHKLNIKGDLKIEVLADKQRIDQVVVNLVNNAIKYAPNSFEVEVLLEKIDNEAKISVIDTGIGIPKEKLLYVFDRYYRVDDSGFKYSGMGLGLYISAEIVKLHGGTVGLISEEKVGSRFWFTLPIEASLSCQ